MIYLFMKDTSFDFSYLVLATRNTELAKRIANEQVDEMDSDSVSMIPVEDSELGTVLENLLDEDSHISKTEVLDALNDKVRCSIYYTQNSVLQLRYNFHSEHETIYKNHIITIEQEHDYMNDTITKLESVMEAYAHMNLDKENYIEVVKEVLGNILANREETNHVL